VIVRRVRRRVAPGLAGVAGAHAVADVLGHHDVHAHPAQAVHEVPQRRAGEVLLVAVKVEQRGPVGGVGQGAAVGRRRPAEQGEHVLLAGGAEPNDVGVARRPNHRPGLPLRLPPGEDEARLGDVQVGQAAGGVQSRAGGGTRVGNQLPESLAQGG
jgi:hypothetical protein